MYRGPAATPPLSSALVSLLVRSEDALGAPARGCEATVRMHFSFGSLRDRPQSSAMLVHKIVVRRTPRSTTILLSIAVSASEELHQEWSDGLGSDVVLLAFQGAGLPIGEDVGDRLRRLAHPRRARPASNHERRCRDGGHALGRQRIVAHDRGIV